MPAASSNPDHHSEAIERLFGQYYGRLCYFAFKMVQNPEAAKDIVHDVFVNCWKSFSYLQDETATRNFLYLSVRNASLNYLRHEGVEKNYAASQTAAHQPVEQGVLDQIIRAEVIAEIRAAIEELPDGCRNVLKMSFLDGLKNEEIAQQMNISINTVKSQKQRALKLLRLKLDLHTFLLVAALLSDS